MLGRAHKFSSVLGGSRYYFAQYLPGQSRCYVRFLRDMCSSDQTLGKIPIRMLGLV